MTYSSHTNGAKRIKKVINKQIIVSGAIINSQTIENPSMKPTSGSKFQANYIGRKMMYGMKKTTFSGTLIIVHTNIENGQKFQIIFTFGCISIFEIYLYINFL